MSASASSSDAELSTDAMQHAQPQRALPWSQHRCDQEMQTCMMSGSTGKVCYARVHARSHVPPHNPPRAPLGMLSHLGLWQPWDVYPLHVQVRPS
mmetsp:Transcript_24827/g.79976  ORF Transcript_24827/g.79976 Transcript_24827/m.79976 type:complete len:95 (-) Transcript_24827:23-307(-)